MKEEPKKHWSHGSCHAWLTGLTVARRPPGALARSTAEPVIGFGLKDKSAGVKKKDSSGAQDLVDR